MKVEQNPPHSAANTKNMEDTWKPGARRMKAQQPRRISKRAQHPRAFSRGR